jgi:hypothetical protein
MGLLRWPGLSGTLLLMGLLRGPRLLRLLGRFRLAPVIPLLIVLGIGDIRGCKEQ